MIRPSSLALVSSLVLLGAGCGGSSGGGGQEAPDLAAIEALRAEIARAGIQPLPDAPLVSHAMFELGRMLFFDKILSGNQDISCATCHLPEFGTSDGRTLSDGVHGFGLGPPRGGGEIIPRNSPALFALHLKDTLFWDGRVQRTDHDPATAFALPPAVPITAEMIAELTPGLALLGIQAMLPPVSREEMRGLPGENPLGDLGDGYNSPGGEPENTQRVWDELTNRLLLTPGYERMLREAYPNSDLQPPVWSFAHAANAIAAFETRAFARTDSPFERFVRGDDLALTRRQVEGGVEFFRAGCAACHSGALFTDQGFHNTGMPQLGPGVRGTALVGFHNADVGRENATEVFLDRYEFRTPSLLNVALTGPWGHAGQFERLRDMVAHYRDPAASNLTYDIHSNVTDPALVTTLVPNQFEVIRTLDPLVASGNDLDVDAVVAFLAALTADSARDMSALVPDSVPSGLPVF